MGRHKAPPHIIWVLICPNTSGYGYNRVHYQSKAVSKDLVIKTAKKPTGTITTTYNYNNSGVAINQLSSISNNDGMSMSYAYSSDFGRLQKIDQIINAGTPFTTQFQYDIYGNVKQKTYPGNFVVNNGYDLLGNLISITGTTGGVNTILWTKTDQNALGQTKGYTMGNGLVSSNTFDSYGNPQEFKVATSGIFDLKMNFDAPSGNLTSRSDVVESLTENFQYDALNRLKSSQVLTAQSVYLTALSTDYTPDGNGNIYKKSDAGTYTYDPNRVNAVTSIIPPTPSTPSTSFISQTPQDITYTAFNKVKTITEDANTNLLTISYGVDDQRCMQTIKQIVGGATTTKYYLPGYEKTIDPNNVTTEVNYINSPDGVCGMYVVAPGATGYYYVYKDHLGTPVTLCNSSGTVVYKQSFDAWGRRRNPHTWDYAMAGYTSILQNTAWLRGFTGHEMLPMFSLINMNGRIYDPISGRMLSPDNYIQSEGFSQSYNRYSYVWNNPLRYVDADGNYVSTAEIDWQQQMRHNQTIEGHNAAEFATQQGWGLDPGAAMESSVMQTGYMESFRYLKYQAPGQGRQSYASDGEESKGLLFDVLDAIISATPVFGPIVMFAKAADRGDVFGAVAAVALGVLDMGAIASFGTAEYSAVSSAESGFAREGSFSAQATSGAVESSGRSISASEMAASWQGHGDYTGVDSWRDVIVKDGTYLASGLPGQSNFYTTINALERVGYSKTAVWEGLQVEAHLEKGYRNYVGIYQTIGDTPAAFGTTYANPIYGDGGLPQVFIPNYQGLQLIETIKLQ